MFEYFIFAVKRNRRIRVKILNDGKRPASLYGNAKNNCASPRPRNVAFEIWDDRQNIRQKLGDEAKATDQYEHRPVGVVLPLRCADRQASISVNDSSPKMRRLGEFHVSNAMDAVHATQFAQASANLRRPDRDLTPSTPFRRYGFSDFLCGIQELFKFAQMLNVAVSKKHIEMLGCGRRNAHAYTAVRKDETNPIESVFVKYIKGIVVNATRGQRFSASPTGNVPMSKQCLHGTVRYAEPGSNNRRAVPIDILLAYGFNLGCRKFSSRFWEIVAPAVFVDNVISHCMTRLYALFGGEASWKVSPFFEAVPILAQVSV